MFSYTNYRYNKAELEEHNKERFAQIKGEVKNLISLYDYSMKVNEIHFNARMEKLSNYLIDKFEAELNPKTVDLYELSRKLDLDTSKESIYVIDTNGIIVNTSFPKDLNLNFYARGIGYREYFEKIWAKQKFVSDRFSTEQVTGRIKKWTFQPTKNNLYLIELGFLSNEAKKMQEMLHQKVKQITNEHKDINEVFIAMQIKGEKIKEIKDSVIQRKMAQVLATKKSIRITTEFESKTIYEDLISLPVLLDETSMFTGMVLYINSDDLKERALLNATIKRFVLMSGLAIFLLVVIIAIRARTITKPIKRLSQKTELISSGKLSERIEVEGRNEIAQLSKNFNTMIEQLEDSYETLEQKVKDRTAEVVQQKDIIEEKHKEITDSINYAERIQRTYLASKEILDVNLGDYFIFFKPKDIVSGDFYWFEKLSNKSFVFAVADSTGHGVPGAIMSLLNISCFENAVKEGIVEPNEILNFTRKSIIERLKKDGSVDGGKDGMDCSLLCFNNEKTLVNFALANNPLWLIRNGELTEFKPDKMPVGKHDKDYISFTKQSLELKKGDVLYTFTDGYADQFGGDKGKKFKYSNLQKLLIENATFSMQEMKSKLEDEFEKWKGDMEQVDDVCIVGIRV